MTLVAAKVRVRLAHRRLDVRVRLAIMLKPHYMGTYLYLCDDKNAAARQWIADMAAKHGVLVWRSSGRGPNRRHGWIVEKPESGSEVR